MVRFPAHSRFTQELIERHASGHGKYAAASFTVSKFIVLKDLPSRSMSF
jgi:hypothetical protein